MKVEPDRLSTNRLEDPNSRDIVVGDTELSTNFDQQVRSADPLNAIRWVDALPAMNKDGEVSSITNLIQEDLTTLKEGKGELSLVDSLASLRDLGHLSASIRRQGIEPVQHITNLESTLIELGKKGSLPPRDSVSTYALWNPLGDKQRTFTGTSEESEFIHAISTWHNYTMDASKSLLQVRTASPTSEAVYPQLEHVLNCMVGMTRSVGNFRRLVPTETFVDVLQPFFQPFEVGGKSYEPPAGAHMNLLLFDWMLWGIDNPNPKYQKYLLHNVDYSPNAIRELIDKLGDSESLTSTFTGFINKVDELNVDDKEQLEINTGMLRQIFTKIISFRRIHLTLAQEQSTIIGGKKLSDDNILIQIVAECEKNRQLLEL